MMRLIQKLDNFDTNTQKSIKYQNLTVFIKTRTLPWCKLFSHFDHSTTENCPYAILYCILKWNGL
jgi:hypothetical protein